MTANQVLQQRIQDSTSTEMQTKFRFENTFIQFLAHCKTKGYQNGTLQSIYASIRSFFDIHRYPLIMRKTDYPKNTANGVRRATDTAIMEILTENNIKLNAKLLTAKDTGLGASDLVALNCNIILDNPNKNLIMITGRRIKTGDIYKTFIGEEAIQALKQYLNLRTKGTRKTKPKTLTNNSPLFIDRYNKRLNRTVLSTEIRNAFLRHGEKHMSAHSLRKRLQTKLEKGNMPTNWIDQILGHQLINSRDAYSLPTDEELREAYLKAYPFISIYSEIEKSIITHVKEEPRQITSVSVNSTAEESYSVAEAKSLTEVKQLLAKGYKYEMDCDGVKLFTKNSNS